MRLHIKVGVSVESLAFVHFCVQECNFCVWYFSHKFYCIVVVVCACYKYLDIVFVCVPQTEDIVFQTSGLIMLFLIMPLRISRKGSPMLWRLKIGCFNKWFTALLIKWKKYKKENSKSLKFGYSGAGWMNLILLLKTVIKAPKVFKTWHTYKTWNQKWTLCWIWMIPFEDPSSLLSLDP